jgi:hypothetical protein
MFAIDGVKLPSNASKRRSGTRADFERQAAKYEAAAHQMLARHRATDALPAEPPLDEKEQRQVERLQHDAAQIRSWLAQHPTDRRGPTGGLRQSNRTDNESAKMGTGKGVLQGYTGAAAVDAKHQIIVEAQAHGTGSEQEVLLPVVDAVRERALLTEQSLVTADAGYHSETNLEALADRGIAALIADAELRKRDERFATQERHRAMEDVLHDKTPSEGRPLPLYQPSDFTYDPVARTCVCPAGKALYRKGQRNVTRGYVAEHFRGAKRDCVPCAHRERCLRHPDRTQTRQVAFFRGAAPGTTPNPYTQQMKARIDSADGRARYAERFGTVEPVFANLCYNKGLARFTLRGRQKVDGQWKLFCLVHNIEKLAHHGYGT